MVKKIHKLKNITPEAFVIICIASHQNDYRVSWALNDKFNIELQRTEDHEVSAPKTSIIQKFSHYSSEGTDSLFTYHLISNKSENGYLLKDMPNIDYFLKISGDFENISIDEMVRMIKEISIVITAFKLEKPTSAQLKRLTF